jgi:beta-glucanase (GH16 family)
LEEVYPGKELMILIPSDPLRMPALDESRGRSIRHGLAILASAGCLAFGSGPALAGGWRPVWADEFTGSGLADPARWGYETGFVRNQEKQYYTSARSENARVAGGLLVLEARKEAYQGAAYTSASLHTQGKGDWLYGRFEVRARLPGGKGMWPAIWMMPSAPKYGGWPKSGELDIMENVGFEPRRVHFTVHTEAYNHTLGTQKSGSLVLPDPQAEFHVYGMEWSSDKVAFFADDSLVFTFRNEGKGPATWPFDQPFHLKLNVAVGGSWGGAIDDAVFPQRMEVDYVRVFAWDPALGIRAKSAGSAGSVRGAAAAAGFTDPFPGFSAAGRLIRAGDGRVLLLR